MMLYIDLNYSVPKELENLMRAEETLGHPL